jgi:phosphatidylserine/phosphatidylglycerophosphate/cardiolipin synthase-like enzyme
MLATVYFSKIKDEIISNIQKATRDIKVAVAWLTDEDIIWAFTKKQESGINVKVVISNREENFKNNKKFIKFLQHGGNLYIATTKFLHNKFCILDDSILINGSYNWSYPAISNEENIMIMNLDPEMDSELLKRFTAKFNYFFSEKCSSRIKDIEELNYFSRGSKNVALMLAKLDEKEILLRQEFENDVWKSFEEAKAQKIALSQVVLDRMMADGGGVDSVRRLLNDEISSGEMKSGFRRLEEHIPHRIDLSFEYLVSRPQYQSLFSPEIVEFCKNLMKKYRL